MCRDVITYLIIGLPSILYFDLLPFLQLHLSCQLCCEVFPVDSQPGCSSPVAQISVETDLSLLNVNKPQRIPNLLKINVPSHATDEEFYIATGKPIAPQHLTYDAEATV